MVEALRAAPAMVMLLLIVGILLGIGNTVLENVKEDGQTKTNLLTTNESATGNATLNFGSEGTILNASLTASNTTGLLTPVTDYSVTTFGVITLVPAGSTAGSGTYNYSYNHTSTTNSLQFNATEQGQLGLDGFSDFQPTIAIVVALVVIVGLLFGALVARRMSDN